jgi:hypothetical protein
METGNLTAMACVLSRQVRAVLPVGLVFASIGLTACVSDTLSTTNTQPQPQPQPQAVKAASQEVPDYDPVQRAEAVAEMREKAVNANSGELTNAYASQDGPNEPMLPAQSAARIQELQQAAERNESSAGANDAQAKQRQIRAMQEKARTHYGSAVQTIEN